MTNSNTMISKGTSTIGQLVAEDYRTASVFQTFGLDFCCGGNRSVEQACKEKEIDVNEVLQALNQLDKNNPEQHNYNNWSLDFLINYIVNNHHKFTRNKLPEIGQYAKKVTSVHGDRHPELQEIYYEFTKLHGEIVNHLDKEEQVLFPYIKKLVEAKEKGRQPESPILARRRIP